jgi:2-polyprenyl-3-methyl-5-hydroxy-6-metoxy-1,4-benzoquinol methylase
MEETKPLFTKEGFQYVRCVSCGMMYINPIPMSEEISETYDQLGKVYFTQPEKLRIDFASGRYDREIDLLTRSNAKGRLLDVGCSTGSFLAAAKRAGFVDVQGVDIAQPSVEFARRQGLTAHVGDFTHSIFPTAQFDVITMWATLEHLANPRDFVNEAYRVLRVGGVLAVSVPSIDSLTQIILGRKYRYVSVNHLNYFDRRTMRRLLENAGFRVVRSQTRAINPLIIIGDLRAVQASTERQITDSTRTLEVKTKRRFALVRLAHRMVDQILYLCGRGDLLLMAAQKPEA